MRLHAFLYIIIGIFLATSVYAELSMSQPNSIYNIGDTIQISVTVSANSPLDGFLKMALICSNETKEFYLAPISLGTDQQTVVGNSLLLTNSFLEGMRGSCHIEVESPKEILESQEFDITDIIDLTVSPNKVSYEPGEEVLIEMNALKPNAQSVDGYLQIELADTNVRVTERVTSDNAQINLTIPNTIKSGNYQLSTVFYERDQSGEETNKGIRFLQLEISQEPTKIDVSIESLSSEPDGNVTFRSYLYDQANDVIQDEISIQIIDSFENIIFERLVRSGEEVVYDLPKNATPGYWSIEANSNELSVTRLFFVESLESADFEIVGDKLIITNIGNVPYQKTIQIAIDNEVEIREMNLEVGGFIEFRLLAPDGQYDVSVTDGETTLTLENVVLTGNIIGVVGLKGGGNIFSSYPLVWLFLIIIIGMFILIMIERVFKKGMNLRQTMEKRKPIVEFERKRSTKNMNLGGVNEAEHTLSLHGTKQEAAIVALNIKNIGDVKSGEILNDIEKSIHPITAHKGVIYRTGGYILGIFAPQVTKSYQNLETSLKVAEKINDKILQYNASHSFKVDFGIGLHLGKVIFEKDKNKVKFTSLGNTVTLTKKLSDLSQQEILFSKNVRRALDSSVKSTKSTKQGIETHSISKTHNREDHKKFLKGFMKRNEFD